MAHPEFRKSQSYRAPYKKKKTEKQKQKQKLKQTNKKKPQQFPGLFLPNLKAELHK